MRRHVPWRYSNRSRECRWQPVKQCHYLHRGFWRQHKHAAKHIVRSPNYPAQDFRGNTSILLVQVCFLWERSNWPPVSTTGFVVWTWKARLGLAPQLWKYIDKPSGLVQQFTDWGLGILSCLFTRPSPVTTCTNRFVWLALIWSRRR